MPLLQKTQNKATKASREQVIAQALSARTAEEIEEATESLARWMEAHPDDTSMEDVFEVLALRRGVR